MGILPNMKILIPENVLEELGPDAPDAAELMPYREDDPAPVGLAEAEAVLRWVAGKRFSSLVKDGPRVRWLHTASAGVDHVLTPDVRAKEGIVVTDSGPAFEIAIPEFVLAWMLSVSRRLPEFDALQRRHEWHALDQVELHGKTVGVIGLGPIGRGTAARAKAFGMRTLGLRRTNAPVEGVDEVLTGPDGLDRLLRESDWVIIAAALTGETRALIGQAQLALMKPGAWLVNIARGPLIDQDALVEALQSGQIGGACLDVFAPEPLPESSPLWDLPNVHIAAHSSGWTDGLQARQVQIFLDNLHRFVREEPLQNAVDMTRGY